MDKKVTETASGGAMGSGSIAAVPSGGNGGQDTPMRLKNFMRDFFQKAQNRMRYKSVEELIPKTYKKLTESKTGLNGVFSELKNSETQSYDERHTVTYGVEDDDGNLMKVTVPYEQSEEFEAAMAHQLAEIEDYKCTGHKGRNISMAELLYELKDQFTILDVEFPTIPADVVYNADQATEAVDDLDTEDGDQSFGDDETGEFGDEDQSQDGEGFGDDLDDDSVEDFENEPEEANDAESILASVMDTLKAQADAEKAKADAEAEKARAKQAEYSAKAAAVELEKQEELVRVESEMEAQKEKEKEAKKISDIAKHNYEKSKSFNEGFNFSPLMQSVLSEQKINVLLVKDKEQVNEVDQFDTMQSLQRQKAIIRQKFTSNPEDAPETKRFKQQQLKFSMDELNAKIRAARSREQYQQMMKQKQDQEDQDRNQNDHNDGDSGEA